METIEIHTNFTNTVGVVHRITLQDLHEASNLEKLRCLFQAPERLRPGLTKLHVTAEAARRFGDLAEKLRGAGADSERVAHFLNRLLFCFFAQHAGLLPPGLVVRVLECGLKSPDQSRKMLRSLFAAMKKGGVFGAHVIEWFNGNLFESNEVLPLEREDLKDLLSVAEMDWSAIEPSIFGTLFERGLDPRKRAQVGAHYTDVKSIERIVHPVVVRPLEGRWQTTRKTVEALLRRGAVDAKRRAQEAFNEFLTELAAFRVLDPACGSGNFLYLSLKALKDLEHRAKVEAEGLGLTVDHEEMKVGVESLHGIELDVVAAELARVTVWIGEIQWMLAHGLQPSRNPILKPLETIERKDAVLEPEGTGMPAWPAASVIVGNPPFLGNKRMRRTLGDSYTDRLRNAYEGKLPAGVDLVTYWFERARMQIKASRAERAGLVATQAIRKGANRKVLDRISKEVPIYEAWRDEPWVNEGAAVRVSLVAFGTGGTQPHLDGHPVKAIGPDLCERAAGSTDLTRVRALQENRGICFMGTSKVGAFDIPGPLAREWLSLPNPHGRPNSEVIRPWANGDEITGRPADRWIIDFGVEMSQSLAAMYEAPFAHVRKHVYPARKGQKREAYRRRWWLHAEARPGLRASLRQLSRYLVTPRVAKHRFFAWLSSAVLPDSRLFAICKDDDFTFGVLSSRMHTIWATANASRHGQGNDPTYNSGDCFETFPFPHASESALAAIETAAIQLDELREKWLNPPEWVDMLLEAGPGYPDRPVAKPDCEKQLGDRTLTNLYNSRPAWLIEAQEQLDHAVAAAYGWQDYSPTMNDVEIMSRLYKLNQARSADLVTLATRPALVSMTPFGKTLQRRALLAEAIIHDLNGDPHLGRTKLAKVFYLADAGLGLDLKARYRREAAGPLDPRALYNQRIGIEAIGRMRGQFATDTEGRMVRYTPLTEVHDMELRATEEFGKDWPDIRRLIAKTRRLNTEQSEIVATLFACWNDLLVTGNDVTDEMIVAEFLHKWHPDKQRFAAGKLYKALAWMRKVELVPAGNGHATEPMPWPATHSPKKTLRSKADRSRLAAVIS